jgi:1-deoxy-D-xylulose-5-phosphate reductoisomerase
MPCVLNAADEVAVEAFLRGELRFPDIPRVIEKVMRDTSQAHLNSMEDVLECDRQARLCARESLASMTHPSTLV